MTRIPKVQQQRTSCDCNPSKWASQLIARECMTITPSKITPTASIYVSREKLLLTATYWCIRSCRASGIPIAATLAARQCNHLRCANFSLHTPNPPAHRPLTPSPQQLQLSADSHPAYFFLFTQSPRRLASTKQEETGRRSISDLAQ